MCDGVECCGVGDEERFAIGDEIGVVDIDSVVGADQVRGGKRIRDGKRVLEHVRARVDAASSVGLGATTQVSSSQAALETTAKLTSNKLSKRHLVLNAAMKGDVVGKRPPMKVGKVQQLAKNRAKPRRTSKLQKATSKKTRPTELKPVFDFHFDGFGMKLSGAVQVS